MTKRPLFLAGCIYLVMTAVSFYALKAALGLTLLGVVHANIPAIPSQL